MKRLEKVFRGLGSSQLQHSAHTLAQSSPVAEGKRDQTEGFGAWSGITTAAM